MADKVKELSEGELTAVMAAILQITRSKSLSEFETKHPPPPSNGMKPMPSRGFHGKTMSSQYFARSDARGVASAGAISLLGSRGLLTGHLTIAR